MHPTQDPLIGYAFANSREATLNFDLVRGLAFRPALAFSAQALDIGMALSNIIEIQLYGYKVPAKVKGKGALGIVGVLGFEDVTVCLDHAVSPMITCNTSVELSAIVRADYYCCYSRAYLCY